MHKQAYKPFPNTACKNSNKRQKHYKKYKNKMTRSGLALLCLEGADACGFFGAVAALEYPHVFIGAEYHSVYFTVWVSYPFLCLLCFCGCGFKC